MRTEYVSKTIFTIRCSICLKETRKYTSDIENSVEAVQFNVTVNTVTIDFKMKEYNLETHFASTVMMRNYGQ